MMINEDLEHLQRCIELATEAADQGHDPFASILVGADGSVLAERRNAVGHGDPTRHPELELIQWSVSGMTAVARSRSTMYTSAEHCAMCSAAHAWVGLGRIVYASSATQTAAWFGGDGPLEPPVLPLRIRDVAPNIPVLGPAPQLTDQVRDLYEHVRGTHRAEIRTATRWTHETAMVNDVDRAHLRRCVELATQAVKDGDEPFGSVLVGPDGAVLAEARNRVGGGDRTRHPEFELARWAATHSSPEQRAASTVYTTGEHCPMCAAAHAWVGLGRIVMATSCEQTHAWRAELGLAPSPVAVLPVRAVAPGVPVDGPVPELADEIRGLHQRGRSAVRAGGHDPGPAARSTLTVH